MSVEKPSASTRPTSAEAAAAASAVEPAPGAPTSPETLASVAEATAADRAAASTEATKVKSELDKIAGDPKDQEKKPSGPFLERKIGLAGGAKGGAKRGWGFSKFVMLGIFSFFTSMWVMAKENWGAKDPIDFVTTSSASGSSGSGGGGKKKDDHGHGAHH